MRTSRLIAGIFVAAISTLLVAPTASAGPSPTFTYSTSGTEATVTGCTADCAGALAIPASVTVSGTPYPITVIGNGALMGEGVTSLTLPSTVTTIEEDAFRDNSIATLDLSANTSLTTIGDKAFYRAGIEDLTLPASVDTIGTSAFRENDFPTLDLSANTGLTTIGNTSFYSSEIEDLTLPDSIENIGFGAFVGSELGALDLSANTNLTYIGLLAFDRAGITSLKLPDSVATIANQAFVKNSIATVDLSNTSLTRINRETFSEAGVESLVLPDSIELIDTEAFFGNNISTVDLSANSQLTEIGSYAFRESHVETLSLPSSIETIGVLAFGDNDLTALDLSSSTALDDIRRRAFQDNNISSVKFGAAVSTIGLPTDSAFSEPTRDHYTFAGWLDTAAGTTTTEFPTSVAGATTIEAQWDGDDTTLTFMPDNGASDIDVDTTYGTPLADVLPDVTRAGYTFDGWHTDATSDAPIAADAVVDDTTTYYAHWVAIPTSITGPTTAEAGDLIAVTGAGFGPNETVTIELHSDPVTLATVTTDASGAFTASGTIPADTAAGDHSIVATSDSSTASSPISVTAAAVDPAAPTDPATPTDPAAPELAETGTGSDMQGTIALALLLAGLGMTALKRRIS